MESVKNISMENQPLTQFNKTISVPEPKGLEADVYKVSLILFEILKSGSKGDVNTFPLKEQKKVKPMVDHIRS